MRQPAPRRAALRHALPVRRTLALYVWEMPDMRMLGRMWVGPEHVINLSQTFFGFGRCASGWVLGGKLTEATKREARACAHEARKRFHLPVKVVWGPPPETR